MLWIEIAAMRRASGETWASILGSQNEDQLKVKIREAANGSPEASLSFLEFLAKHSSPRVRRSVALALSSFRYAEVILTLLGLLGDPRWEVREAGTACLAKFTNSEVIPLLERMARDKSKRVRLAASKALLQLRGRSIFDLLSVGTLLIEDRDPLIATTAFTAIRSMRSDPGKAFSKALVGGAKRYHPTLYHLATPRVTPIAMKGATTGGLALGPVPAIGAGYTMGLSTDSLWYFGLSNITGLDVKYRSIRSEPQFHSIVKDVNLRAVAKRKRHLYGWWRGLTEEDRFTEGEPEFISCLPGYTYTFSVIVASQLEILLEDADDFGSLPEEIGSTSTALAVALLPDNEYIELVDEPAVRTLHVPAEGSSSIISFRVRGLKRGIGTLDILVYYRGCLVMRARTAGIQVKRKKGTVSVGERRPVTGTVLGQDADPSITVAHIERERRGSLWVSREDHNTIYALFYEDANGLHFTVARVPSASINIDFQRLREKLRSLVEMKGMLWSSVFLRDDFDFSLTKENGQRALEILCGIGHSLWASLFSHPQAQPIRKELQALLMREGGSSILQVVSKDIFLPWQLIYIDDGQDTLRADLLWGMRFQIEQTLDVGIGMKALPNPEAAEPMIAYINKYLPRATLKEHEDLFPLRQFTEEEVIKEFCRSKNRRPAFYFYCHAGYEPKMLLDSWIKLTDDSSRLTLRMLKEKTSFEPSTQEQVEFESAPLIFLNACESGQVESDLYRSFVGFLLQVKKAGGIIGTETEMPAFFATHFAKRFWQIMQRQKGSAPVSEVLYELRRDYWSQYTNPLGLLYSLYSNPELRLAIPKRG